ncbi:MAG: SIS domain-containing protein [Rubrivivax sp.]|jgi:RpiR family carbohydrate utilization transcriptional regulator|nr:SIS domain-containing protein [Rubrivivax sp.]
MLDRIRASIPALPPAEQRVARLLLSDPRSFATLPVSELADRSHVSKPTVVRFCRSVGYDGLADFKLKLAGSVNEGVPFVHRSVDDDDKAGDIVVKVVDNAVAALLRYRNAAAHQSVERAIATLAEAGRRSAQGARIEFYGVGNSGIVAQDAQHKFFRLGVTAHAVSDSHIQVMSATMLKPGDVAVVISNSGRSRDLLDVADIARRRGATVISITASGSPLALDSRHSPSHSILLAADHPEDADRYSPMVSRLLHLMIIDILTTGVALRLGSDSLRPALQAIKKNLRERRYVAAPGARAYVDSGVDAGTEPAADAAASGGATSASRLSTP